MLGDEVLYVCGTDENAASIILEAMRQGLTPKELCDRYYPLQKEVFEKLGIKFDVFSRTSKQVHYDVVKEFYLKLWEKGYVYPKRIKQLWCPKDRKVLPDRFVVGKCPKCGSPDQYGEACEVCASWYEAYELVDPKCSICGTKPEILESTHYFLKLSALRDAVLDYVKPKTYWRKATYNKTISWLEQVGLRDKDITRDYDWGPPAPFPGAKGQVIYNWAENLLGYISATRDWAELKGDGNLWKVYWQDNGTELYCFLGKDNLFFHTILFPALLIANGDYVLPKNVVVNEFVNLEGRKLSTSRGWVVWLHDLLEKYDPDLIRFYGLAIAPEVRDTDFRWKDFQEKVNNELIATLGNYIYRVLRLIEKNFKKKVPEPRAFDEEDVRMMSEVKTVSEDLKQALLRFEFKEAFNKLMRLAKEGNRYMNIKRPWEHVEGSENALYVSIQVVFSLALLMHPFLPFSSERLLRMLKVNLDLDRLLWRDLERKIEPGHEIGDVYPLFKKVSDEEVDKEIANLYAKLKEPD